MSFSAIETITAKRDGKTLSKEQISDFVAGYHNGSIAHEQAAALLMAIFLNGATDEETVELTQAMIASGSRQELASLRTEHGWAGVVDKHSTGGVGDKITLILTPLLASFGLAVPQLSGRGLGHTGGTLDKLEAIPGFRSSLTHQEYFSQLTEIGAVICAAGDSLAPVDGKLYALRDVTGTVESIPLIAASIMSKKIAEGTQALVLDVKVGSGAFMKDVIAARELANLMVTIGEAAGVATTALLTRMDTPLGYTVGNSLEVEESLDVLAGEGPADVRELTLALAQPLLQHAGITSDPALHLDNGAAAEQFHKLVKAQGGDPQKRLPLGQHRADIVAQETGYVQRLDALAIGQASWKLGAGRTHKESAVAFGAGIRLAVKEGDHVSAGDLLARCYAEDSQLLGEGLEQARQAFTFGGEAPQQKDLIIDTVNINA